MGMGVIAGHLRVPGTLPYTHMGLGHCQMSARTRGIVRCLQDLGVSPDARGDQWHLQMLDVCRGWDVPRYPQGQGCPLGAHGL